MPVEVAHRISRRQVIRWTAFRSVPPGTRRTTRRSRLRRLLAVDPVLGISRTMPDQRSNSFSPPVSVRSTTRRPPDSTQRSSASRRPALRFQCQAESTITESVGGVVSTRSHDGASAERLRKSLRGIERIGERLAFRRHRHADVRPVRVARDPDDERHQRYADQQRDRFSRASCRAPGLQGIERECAIERRTRSPRTGRTRSQPGCPGRRIRTAATPGRGATRTRACRA